MLPNKNWFPHNKTILDQFLLNYKSNTSKEKVAVFDWDDTSIFNDIGDNYFLNQLNQLNLRLSPTLLEKILPDNVNQVTELMLNNRPVLISKIKQDLLKDYEVLYQFIQNKKKEKAFELDEYQNFKVMMLILAKKLKDHPKIGAGFIYPWTTRFLSGFSETEVKQTCKKLFNMQLSKSIQIKTIFTKSNYEDPLSYSYIDGMRVIPEIADLMNGLKESGFKVFVVTASYQGLVESLCHDYGYNLVDGSVYGIRVEKNNDILTDTYIGNREYPVTFRQGKADIIRQYLPTEPLFVSGDSNTDYEMLTEFSNTELRLIINRHLTGDIENLYKLVQNQSDHYLLQGRDEKSGSFKTSQESILLT